MSDNETKRSAKLQREMDEHPERFDFGDIPPDRVRIEANEASIQAGKPQWLKRLVERRRERS